MKTKIFLLLAACAFAFAACSDDDPVVLTDIRSNAASFELNEEGTATLEFSVTPAEAQVNGVDVRLDIGHSLTYSAPVAAGDGTWRVQVKVDDLRSFGTSQRGTLTANQEDGTTAETSFTLTDPFAVADNAFTAHYPYTVSLCDAATHTAMRLPIILEGERVAEIDNVTLLLNSSSSKLNASDFVLGRDKDASNEYGIFVKQERVDAIVKENPRLYHKVDAVLELNLRNGRVGCAQLIFMFAAPETTLKSETLTFRSVDLATPDFTTDFALNQIAQHWHRIGYMEAGDKEYEGEMDLSNAALYRIDGTRVDDGDFFTAVPDIKADRTDVFIQGDAACNYVPSTYHFVYHTQADWTYKGKKYERIRADYKYEIIIK